MATAENVVLAEGNEFEEGDHTYRISEVYDRPIHSLAEWLGDGTAIARLSGDCWDPSLSLWHSFIGGVGSVDSRTIYRCNGRDHRDNCVAKITFKIVNTAPTIGGIPGPGGKPIPFPIPQMILSTDTITFACTSEAPSGGLIFDAPNKVALFSLPEGEQPSVESGEEVVAGGIWY